MKIGILTFHRAHNYGAMLQAYALRHVLCCMGHEVEFVSYRQPKIEEAYQVWTWRFESPKGLVTNFKNLVANVLTLYRRQRRSLAFRRFAQRFLPESKEYDKNELLGSSLKYDVVFFGSDQIWTTRFLGYFDDVFWGDVKLSNGKKIAYAPSMELRSISASEQEYIKRNIKNFDSVSAREIQMSELLESITGLKVPTVVDPTLLCQKGDYLPLIESSKYVPPMSYVLVYQVGHHAVVDDIAQKVAEQLHCPIVEIGSDVLLHNKKTYKDDFSPSDFINLIANATFIVSCSFHGTAFSVNFHKPFYSVLIEGIDSRATSFLFQLGLMSHGIRTVEEVNTKEAMSIDYSAVVERLNRLRLASMSYIEQSLG